MSRPLVVRIGIVAAAVVLAASGGPWPLGLLSIVLVWFVGDGVLRLLLGEPTDRVVHVVVGSMIGLSVWLGILLVQDWVAIPIVAWSNALCLGVVSIALLLVRERRQGFTATGFLSSPVATGRSWVAAHGLAFGSGGVIVLAAVLAVTMQPERIEPREVLQLTDHQVTQHNPYVSSPGADVAVAWALTSFEYALATPEVNVRVVVGDTEIDASRIEVVAEFVKPPATGSLEDADSMVAGKVTFPAPQEAGRYRVLIEVSFEGQAGEPDVRGLTTTVLVEP